MSEEYKSGSIDIILGCMFSGKTTELITRCKKWNAISNNVLCINYTEDKRYGQDDHIYSHSLDKIKCINVLKLAEISTDIINSSCVILINEGQFFSDLLEYCKLWADKFKKHTGWEQSISFEKTMGDLLEYWRNKVKNGRTFLNI
jgi:thymidine kinase